MRESEEKVASVGGRFDLLLKQLGAGVVAESLGVDVEELARIQSGAAPLEGGVRERLGALAESMGVAVDWWDASGVRRWGWSCRKAARVRAWARSGSPRSVPR